MTADKSQNLAKMLSDVIRINTVSPPGNEKDLALYIADILRSNGLEPVVQDLGNNRANLFCEIGCGDECRLILNGHLDVVPAEGEWKHNPFEGIIDDGYLFGRGACDMKAGVVCMLQAFIDTFKEADKLKGRLKLFLVADEETSNLGLNSYLKEHEEEDRVSVKRNYAVIGEPTNLRVCNSHYGVERYWINVHGESAHSSKPELGINAIAGASSIVESLGSYHAELRTRVTEWGSPSCAVTMIEGGEKQNSIPAHARVFIDRRTVPGEKAEDVKREVEDWLKNKTDLKGCSCDVELYFTFGSGLLPADNSFLSAVLKENDQSSPEVFPAGCEEGIMLSHGYEAVVLGPGDIKDAHMPDEKVLVSDLGKAYEIYRRIIKKVLM